MFDLNIILLCEAWTIGVAIAAPVGPIGMLCIRKTLEVGILGALLVGLGAALADSVYGLIAALGLATITHFLIEHSNIIRLLGGIFLLYLAYKEVRSGYTTKEATLKNTGMLGSVVEVFFLTLTNPMTILSFIGIFSSISTEYNGLKDLLIMVIGVFLGSMTWWCILGAVITKIKNKIPTIWLERIKYLSGFILAGFGIASIINGMTGL